jgi:hypothetical protein
MFIYNVTTKVDWSIHDAWVAWMQDVHIPEVTGTGCFEKHQFVRVLDIDEADGATYAAQYYAANMAKYNHYVNAYAPALKKKVLEKWGQHALSFRSLMEIVD